MNQKNKLVLLVAEGLGLSSSWSGNAVFSANPINFFNIWSRYPHLVLKSDSKPDNSLNSFMKISSGCEVFTNQEIITKVIKNNIVSDNKVINQIFSDVLRQNSALHLIGNLSDSKGKYGDIDHLIYLLGLAKRNRLFKVYIHLLLDNSSSKDIRDFYPLLQRLSLSINSVGIGEIASVTGIDNVSDENKSSADFIKAFRAIVNGTGRTALSPEQALANLKNNESPSKLSPTIINYKGEASGKINNFDGIIFFNYDNSRLSNFILTLTQKVSPYSRCIVPKFLNLVSFFNPFKQENQSSLKIAFAPFCENNLTKILTENKFSQLYISDSSRVVQMVDYFQNADKNKNAFIKNVFILAPTNYEKYFFERKNLLRKILEEFRDNLKKYDVVILDLPIIIEACRTSSFQNIVSAIKDFDSALKYFEMIVLKENATMLLTSNDGRASQISSSSSESNLPLVLLNQEALEDKKNGQNVQSQIMVDILKKHYALIDIAPTILDLAGIAKPDIMKGESLLPILSKGKL